MSEGRTTIPLFCIPTVVQFSNDLIQEIPFPSLKSHLPSCIKNTEDSKIGITGKNNLLQDPQHREEIMHLCNSDDDDLVKAIYDTMECGDAEYVSPNLMGASLKQDDLDEPSNPTTTLMHTLIQKERKKKRNVVQIKPIAYQGSKKAKAEHKKPIKKPTPVKKAKPPIQPIIADQNKENEKPKHMEQDEPKPKKKKPEKTAKATDVQSELDALVGHLEEFFDGSEKRSQQDVQQLEKLQSDVKYADSKSILCKIDANMLIKLLNILIEDIRRTVVTIPTDNVSESIQENTDIVKSSFHCSIIALDVMTAKRISKELILEDVIESILEFTKFISHKYIFPTVQSEEDTIKAKTRRQSAEHSHSCDYYVLLLNQIFTSLHKFLKILKFRDEWVLGLVDVALSSFFVDGLKSTQLISLEIVTLVFGKYKNHRDTILRDIITSILKLPNSKRSIKNYAIGDKQFIQIFTSLILQLFSSCSTVPYGNEEPTTIVTKKNQTDDQSDDDEIDENEQLIENITEGRLISYYEESYACCKIFIDFFLNRCTKESEDGENNRIIIEHFVDDLLITLSNPHFPSAHLVLNVISHSLSKIYLEKKQPDAVRVMSVDILGKIASRCIDDSLRNKKALQDDQDSPKKMTNQSNFLIESFESKFQLSTVDINKLHVYGYLSYLASTKKQSIHARQYLICEWFHDNRSTQHSSTTTDQMLLSLWSRNVDDFNNSKQFNYAHSKMKEIYLSIQCARKDSIINKFSVILNHIVGLIDDEKVKVRSKAIKSLQSIIEQDPSIKNQQFIQIAIRQHLTDQSPLVRDCMMDLISKMIQSNESISPMDSIYIKMVINGVRDVAKSVRKRSVTILGELCNRDFENDDDDLICEICIALSTRLHTDTDEEDAIRELVVKIFDKLWFDHSTPSKLKSSILQMVDVISRRRVLISEMNDHWLVKMISACLKKDSTKYIKYIKIMIEKLLLHMAEHDTTDSEIKGRDNITQCMLCLNLICICNAELMTNQFAPLLPYLDDVYLKRNVPKSTMIFYATSIFEMMLAHITKLNSNDATLLFKKLYSLLFIAPKMSKDAMNSTAKCLCALVTKIKSMIPKLTSIICAIYKNAINHDSKQDSQQGAMNRTLNVLGLLSQFLDLDALPIAMFPSNSIKDCGLQIGQISTNLWNLFMSKIKDSNESIVQGATKGLGSLLIKNPKLYALESSTETIRKLLCDPSNGELIQKAMLENFRDFLIHEEMNMTKQASTGHNVDHGIATSFMGNYIDAIAPLLQSTDSNVRFVAVEVMELILKQGLYIPNKIVPRVMTLLADSNLQTRQLVFQIMTFVVDRFRDVFVAHAGEAIAQGFHFLKIVQKSEFVRGLDSDGKGFYCDLLQLCKDCSKKERISMIDSIVTQMIKSKFIGQIFFICEILSNLNFNHIYEILNVIVKISKFIDEHGEPYLEQLKLEINHDDEISNFKKFGQNVIQLVLMIRLRRMLQEYYHLTDKKCEEYLQDSINKLYDKQPPTREMTRIRFEYDVLLSEYNNATTGQLQKNFYKKTKAIFREYQTQSFDLTKATPKKRGGRRASTSPKSVSPKVTKKQAASKKRRRQESDESSAGEESEAEDVWKSDQSEEDQKSSSESESDEMDQDEEDGDEEESPKKPKKKPKKSTPTPPPRKSRRKKK